MGKWFFLGCVALMGGSLAWIFIKPMLGAGMDIARTQVPDIDQPEFLDKLKSEQFSVDVDPVVQKRPHQYRLVLGAFSSHEHADERRFEVLLSGVPVLIEQSGNYWRVVTEWYDTPTQVDGVVSQLLQQNIESELEERVLEQ